MFDMIIGTIIVIVIGYLTYHWMHKVRKGTSTNNNNVNNNINITNSNINITNNNNNNVNNNDNSNVNTSNNIVIKKADDREREIIVFEEIRETAKRLQDLKNEYREILHEKHIKNKIPEIYPKSYEELYDPSLHVWDDFPLPYWVYDFGACKMYFVNKAALKMWNVGSMQDMHRKSFADNSEASERQFSHWTTLWEKDPTHSIETVWTFYPNGKPVPTNVLFTCHKFPSGRIGTNVVITSLKKNESPREAELLRSHESTRHSADMISWYNMSGQLLFQNPASHILGLKLVKDGVVDSLEPKFDVNTFLPYIYSRTIVQELIQSIIARENKTVQAKLKFPDSDKTLVYHLIALFIIDDPVSGRKSVLIIERDITALILQKEKLRQEELTNQELIKAKARAEIFLGAMSHEIRTPIHGIIGLSQAMLDPKLSLTGKTLKLAQNIANTGDHLLNLINNTLDLTKLEANRMALNVAPYDPYFSVKQVVSWVENLASEKKIYMMAKLPVNLSELLGDLSRVEQILLNLVANAIKFTTKGGVEISAHTSKELIHSVTLRANEFSYVLQGKENSIQSSVSTPYLNSKRITSAKCNDVATDFELSRRSQAHVPSAQSKNNNNNNGNNKEKNYIHFLVKDTGIGIKEKDLPKLFQRFAQLETSSYTRTYEGSGLGLSISKELTFLMEGAIGVQSREGEGSTFWVSIPYSTPPVAKRMFDFVLVNISVIVIDERSHVIETFEHYFTQWKIKFANGPKQTPIEAYVKDLCSKASSGVTPPDVIFISSYYVDMYPRIMEDLQMVFPNTKFYLTLKNSLSTNPPGNFHGCITTPLFVSELAYIFCDFLPETTKIIYSPKIRNSSAANRGDHNNNHNNNNNNNNTNNTNTNTGVSESKTTTTISNTSDKEVKKLSDLTILLVEDNPINQLVAENFLKRSGITKIHVEPNGLKGLNNYKNSNPPPDLVLMDILMPEMNGFESSEGIRKYEADNSLKRTPIIALTASHTSEVYDKLSKAGMNDILCKPFKEHDLVEVIKKNLGMEKKIKKLEQFQQLSQQLQQQALIAEKSAQAPQLSQQPQQQQVQQQQPPQEQHQC